MNCDRPSVRRELPDLDFFLAGCPAARPVVLDEVHRLDEPTMLLKLAADGHPTRLTINVTEPADIVAQLTMKTLRNDHRISE